MDSLTDITIFHQLAAILVIASVIGFVTVRLRQPLIVAFILTGLAVGPDALDIVRSQDRDIIEILAEFGIALLFFMVGLKLDYRVIRQTGAVALIAGIVQVAVTMLIGFLLGLMIGLGMMDALFIGLAVAFSSTIIVVKLLSDRRALDSLYGRVALGILIVQDFLVILATVVVSGMVGAASGDSAMIAQSTSSFHTAGFLMVLAKAAGLVGGIIIFVRYGARPLTNMLARNGELMVVFCISFAVLMAAVSEYLHFSKELGGLIAGVALASTPYNNMIAARLAPLRDFLLLFFFAHLGAHMHLSGLSDHIVPALIFSAFVLLGKPLIITAIMHAMRFRKRTGFFAGVALSQISEFSLVLASMGLGAGLIGQDMLNLVTLIALITMGLSTYGIVYSANIYGMLEQRFKIFQRAPNNLREEQAHHHLDEPYDVILFGLGRYGLAMARRFTRQGYRVLGVDFDPDAMVRAQEDNIAAVYGDAADPEFPSHLPLDKAKIIVFCFHHYMTGPLITDLRRTLARTLRDNGYSGPIAATSHHPEHDYDLHEDGVDMMLGPFEDAAYYGTEKVIAYLEDPQKPAM